MDRGDRDGIASCYAPDSYDDHGAFKGSGQQFADFLCNTSHPLKTHHQLGQCLFDVSGEEAWGETYFTMYGLGNLPLYGRYVDYFQRLDDQWLLKYRRVVPEVTVVGDDIESYWRSGRDRSDPVYDHLRAPTDVLGLRTHD